ncbi:N-acylneuraminate cytidylyltransferase [Condylostylus longicornis]|uniref:N-acylneuraminate cytidylyltransferase n=1 Tax=Condylostylus longicornis TaxID=2530218 RepID=UPI00244E4B1C|nr:N-acylneuraminate cytidylyltransferase [Condylostylus longicornis]
MAMSLSCPAKLFWLKTNEPQYALILARGGSKGIPRKNLQKLNGVTLLERTIKIIQETNLFTEIWVSTEDKEINETAQKIGALSHTRPKYLAEDETSSLDAVKEFLNKYKYIKKLALFQCTSPFLRHQYIKDGINKFQNSECVFSVTQSFKLRWQLYDNERELVHPINFKLDKRPRRQDWSGEFYENGMFYFANRYLILENNSFQSKLCKIVIISQYDGLEIDTLEDLDIAEYLTNKRQTD